MSKMIKDWRSGDVVDRALTAAKTRVDYILGAGGRDPYASTPVTKRGSRYGSDCIGFALWCLGIDRYQPVDGEDIDYPFYEGWINTDSMLMDANGPRRYFEPVAYPFPGCVIVYPSTYKNGKRDRLGHIGVVVSVKGSRAKDIKVIDCNASLTRKLSGFAISETTAASFVSKPGALFVRAKWIPIDKASEPVVESPKLGDRLLKLELPYYMRGSDVVELQRLLNVVGFLMSEDVDGVFGPWTEKIVRAFQSAHGLTVDGKVGPQTIKALRAASVESVS